MPAKKTTTSMEDESLKKQEEDPQTKKTTSIEDPPSQTKEMTKKSQKDVTQDFKSQKSQINLENDLEGENAARISTLEDEVKDLKK
jgi:hypothetical protein